ncbi:hypothetical protein SASPL_105546 [Salvia splendens]|uniref:intramembrane prenyl-peptidase Rce1 n=1 Tax=Salvia splendens TaxID=180675 RepID=A0A8X8YNT2_SALSN|nr:hypothetical protein SASPL_105546 [Salvia splendens]
MDFSALFLSRFSASPTARSFLNSEGNRRIIRGRAMILSDSRGRCHDDWNGGGDVGGRESNQSHCVQVKHLYIHTPALYVSTVATMEREDADAAAGVTKLKAVSACIGMAVFYVAILYSPTLILRLPPPNSYTSFLTRRFICAAVSSIVSLIVSSLILPITGWEASSLLRVYGIRMDHIWQSLVYPLLLTSFMYSGSFALKFLSMLQTSREYLDSGGNLSVACVKSISLMIVDWVVSTASCMSSWRNYFVWRYDVTEKKGLEKRKATRVWKFSYFYWEFLGTNYRRTGIQSLYDPFASVWRIHFSLSLSKFQAPHPSETFAVDMTRFRYCYFMLKFNLIGGFNFFNCSSYEPLTGVLSPTELQLAQSLSSCRLEQVNKEVTDMKQKSFQLVYTVIFGAYASFLLIRTGHLTAPLIAHIFCNFMGLPVIHSGRSGMVSLVFVIGVVSFSKLLFPLTTPRLYNHEGDNCSCCHRYCSWS